MIEMVSRLSPFTADQFLLSILMMLVVVIGVPMGVSFYVNKKRTRRKRPHSPQRIGLATDEVLPRSCDHLRSKSRAKETADGEMVSTCKKCGVQMTRTGPGRWVATSGGSPSAP